MEFIDHIQALAARIPQHREALATEEAAKNALVMPFINALGYNVFDPTEVVPEFTADVGIKKGEKVDYAIMKDGTPIMLFECKGCGADLSRSHASQLYRYFSVTEARIAVLTNGIQYEFYSDLDAPNRLDEKPFLEFDVTNIQDTLVPELRKLTKANFDVDAITEAAGELKYTREIRKLLTEQLTNPDGELVRLLAGRVFSGRLTGQVREQFSEIVRKAFRLFVHEQISDRLKSALKGEESEFGADTAPAEPAAGRPLGETTADEREAFHVVRAILAQVVDPDRVAARDVKTYFGILLDDNNRKPLARLHFNTGQKYIGLFDNSDREEDRIAIDRTVDIYRYADRLRATPTFYDETLLTEQPPSSPEIPLA